MQQKLNQQDLTIILQSSGYKAGPLPEKGIDLFIDCRAIANPCYIPSLGGKSGDDQEVQEWVAYHTDMDAYYAIVEEALTRIPIRRNDKENPYEKPFVIHCFCAHGIHRSRSMKHLLKIYLSCEWKVEVR